MLIHVEMFFIQGVSICHDFPAMEELYGLHDLGTNMVLLFYQYISIPIGYIKNNLKSIDLITFNILTLTLMSLLENVSVGVK
jgi:hypothetical protein